MSQMVKAMMMPKPKVQMKRPSETGPNEPSLAPPGEPAGFDFLQEGDDVALLFRGDVRVIEDRHVLRAGDHGLVDVLFRYTSKCRCELSTRQAPPAAAAL